MRNHFLPPAFASRTARLGAAVLAATPAPAACHRCRSSAYDRLVIFVTTLRVSPLTPHTASPFSAATPRASHCALCCTADGARLYARLTCRSRIYIRGTCASIFSHLPPRAAPTRFYQPPLPEPPPTPSAAPHNTNYHTHTTAPHTYHHHTLPQLPTTQFPTYHPLPTPTYQMLFMECRWL